MPVLSIIVPAHNSGTRLEGTVDLLRRELGDAGIEVIIVENGSTDDTWEVAQRLAATSGPFPVLACQSDVGLGAAYREGIRRASGQTLLLTADDLPFGLTDIDAWPDLSQLRLGWCLWIVLVLVRAFWVCRVGH